MRVWRKVKWVGRLRRDGDHEECIPSGNDSSWYGTSYVGIGGDTGPLTELTHCPSAGTYPLNDMEIDVNESLGFQPRLRRILHLGRGNACFT